MLVWHAHCFSVNTAESCEIEKHVLSCIGGHLHPAIYTRKTEETYLRNVSERLVKTLLPSHLTNSRYTIISKLSSLFWLIIVYQYFFRLFTILIRDILSNLVLQKTLDVIADPDTINQLLIIGLRNDVNKEPLERKEMVHIFENFAAYPVEAPQTVIRTNLPL